MLCMQFRLGCSLNENAQHAVPRPPQAIYNRLTVTDVFRPQLDNCAWRPVVRGGKPLGNEPVACRIATVDHMHVIVVVNEYLRAAHGTVPRQQAEWYVPRTEALAFPSLPVEPDVLVLWRAVRRVGAVDGDMQTILRIHGTAAHVGDCGAWGRWSDHFAVDLRHRQCEFNAA